MSCSELLVPTITSDVPNVLSPNSPIAGLPLGGGPTFTFYPPSVYSQFFTACPPKKACVHTEKFPLNSIPDTCCILVVTNGDGRGSNQVASYQLFVNGKRLLPNKTGDSQIFVKLKNENSIKVVMLGAPFSKIFVSFTYDPAQSN